MRFLRRALVADLLFLWTALASPSHAAASPEPLRVAVVVGNDRGGPDQRPLRYAQRDASRMHELLVRLGAFSPEHTSLLLGRSAEDALAALAQAEAAFTEAARAGRPTVLVVYYSGHAKDGSLRMGPTQLPLATLRERLAKSQADVKVALLDSCRSGEMTRTKGARAGPEFRVDLVDARVPRGLAILTSSSGDEDSQESDLLGASFFTHFLISGLLGDADVSGDGKVTLSEAYAHAYARTVGETAATRAGPQHPTFSYDLAGSGELWMTDTQAGPSRGRLVFPQWASGTYYVLEGRRRAVVAEVAKSPGEVRRLALAPGEYEVKRRAGDQVLLGRVIVSAGSATVLDERSMQRVALSDDVAKGTDPLAPLLVRPARVSIGAWLGGQGFFSAPVREGFFPAMGLAGIEVELRDWLRPDMFVSFDLGLGGADHTVELDGFSLATRVGQLTGGISLAYEWDLGDLAPFVGARLSSILVSRAFPGGELPPQTLLTTSPGLVAGASYALGAHLLLGLRGRASYLVYNLDGNRSLGYGDVALGLRWEF